MLRHHGDTIDATEPKKGEHMFLQTVRLSLFLVAICWSTGIVVAQTDGPSTEKPAADRSEKVADTTDAQADVEGTWERVQETNQGRYRVVKSHVDGKTEFSVYDSQDQLVHRKTSRYEIDTTGDVRIFTYFDNKIVSGRGTGQFDARENSYVYRIDGDMFFEMHGLLISNPGPVQILIWKRVKDD